MRRFFCGCGQEIYFDNTFCGACGRQLGFDPQTQSLLSLESGKNGWQATQALEPAYRFCEHREHELQCNWLIPAEESDLQCLSCVMTRTIPVLNKPDSWRRWRTLESAKRRMLYGLLVLGLSPSQPASDRRLLFDFMEDKRSNPEVALEHVLSGHASGVITINAAEADGSYREAAKEAMNEPYRTLLGHFRHEIGHFYWELLIQGSARLAQFRALFGDDSQDYRASLDDYYASGPKKDWQENFISAYASAHPLEDWAETWAHYLLMMDTLETALAYELIQRQPEEQLFENWLGEWLQLVEVMNALSRSTGHADTYPFVISEPVQQKLKFIHDLVSEAY